MSSEVPESLPPLTDQERLAAEKLSSEELAAIDSTILSCVQHHWRKVVMVVVLASEQLEARHPDLSSTFYALRVQDLADRGFLVSKGDLDYIRFSEVRLLHQS
jgi:hypothetical protein